MVLIFKIEGIIVIDQLESIIHSILWIRGGGFRVGVDISRLEYPLSFQKFKIHYLKAHCHGYHYN